jgi:uncharacterized protein YoxC/RNA polymerase subunit RPABC4/transcription elongation factor Spt4
MSEHCDQAAASPAQICASCSKPLKEEWEFCPFCGAKKLSSSTIATVEIYAKESVNAAIANRLKDQGGVVREIADKIEDRVSNRFKTYFWLFGLLFATIFGFITFLGINTLSGISQKIEPVVKDAEQRVQAVRRTIDETSKKVDPVKAAVDRLSSDVDVQTKRVAQKGGEISQKFQNMDTTADAFSRRLDAEIKSLETKVTQVSTQMADLSIRQVYPALGQKEFVIFNGGPWKGAASKKLDERWIDIVIDARYQSDLSFDQVHSLTDKLTKAGYRTFFGTPVIGGPYARGWGPFGDTNNERTSIFYFKPDAAQMAASVAALVSETLPTKDVNIKFTDLLTSPKDEVFLVTNSGIDLQLYVFRPNR